MPGSSNLPQTVSAICDGVVVQIFELGITSVVPVKEALIMNSAHSITSNQIHMHTYASNGNMRQFLTDLYKGVKGSLLPSLYSTLRDIPPPLPAGS
jgi:hypothetical protein